VAATDQKAVVGRVADVKADTEPTDDPCDMAKTGRRPLILLLGSHTASV